MNDYQNSSKNQAAFKLIIDKLRKARKDKPDIELHLNALSQLIQNQDLILRTCNFERIEFDFFYDLIFDYETSVYVRDEVLIYKSAIKWLSNPEFCDQRMQFTNEIMQLIKFAQMNENELKQCFGFLDTYPLSNQLKDYLQNIQCQMMANHRIRFDSLFVDCMKI